MHRDWYEIEGRAESDELTIWLYDEIGERDMLGEDPDVRTLVERITQARGPITVRVNSPGGNVWDGVAIHSALRASEQPVTVYIDGLAASVASYIAIAGDRVVIAPGGMVMVHDPWGMVAGTAEELRELADVLDKVRVQMASGYAARMQRSLDEVLELMAAQTWYSAEEAVAAGLADEVGAGMRLAALVWDLASLYGAVPSGALPYRDLPLASEERAWDAGGAVSRVWQWAGGDEDLDPEKFSQAFLYRTPAGDPKTRGAYKLPIADVIDDRLTAVPRGVFAAAGVLQGGRGGADIPADDLRRCKAHLARYYRRLGREAPWDAADLTHLEPHAACGDGAMQSLPADAGERSAGGAPADEAAGGAPADDAGTGQAKRRRRLWSCGLWTYE